MSVSGKIASERMKKNNNNDYRSRVIEILKSDLIFSILKNKVYIKNKLISINKEIELTLQKISENEW